MFTRMNLYFIIVASLIISSIFIINKYLTYWEKIYPNTYMDYKYYKERKKQKNILEIMLFITIISGFVLYFIEKKNEYKEGFSYLTFIFGSNTCKQNKDNALLNYLNR